MTEAKGQLTELVRRAESGEDIILTRYGQPAARLVSIRKALTPQERRAILEKVRREGAANATPGPSAARSQDFLYDDTGMPG